MMHGMQQGRDNHREQVDQEEGWILPVDKGQAFEGQGQATFHDKGKKDQNHHQDADGSHHQDPAEIDAFDDMWISS